MTEQNTKAATGRPRMESPFVFPPKTPEARHADEVNIGNRVVVNGHEYLGRGVVIGLEPDGRLARLLISGADGWWYRSDLRKVEAE